MVYIVPSYKFILAASIQLIYLFIDITVIRSSTNNLWTIQNKILSNLPNTSASSVIYITVSSTYCNNNTAKIDHVLCVFSQEDNWIPYVIFYHCIFGF